jgi:P27 family predicted phage terminase small subunit
MAGNKNSGRKPKPTVTRVVVPLRGINRENLEHTMANEPKPATAEKVPPPPAHLVEEAKVVWRSLAKELHPMGLLSKVDYQQFEQLCVVYARWQKAEKLVAQAGEVVLDKKRNLPVENPWLKVARQAFEQYRKIAPNFGLDPSARAKIGSVAPKAPIKDENPWAGLIPGASSRG